MLWQFWRLIKCRCNRCRWVDGVVCVWQWHAQTHFRRRCSHRGWSWLKQLSLKFPLNFAPGHWETLVDLCWISDIRHQNQPNDCFERCEWFSSPSFHLLEQFAKLFDQSHSCKGEDTRNLLVCECDRGLGDSVTRGSLSLRFASISRCVWRPAKWTRYVRAARDQPGLEELLWPQDKAKAFESIQEGARLVIR